MVCLKKLLDVVHQEFLYNTYDATQTSRAHTANTNAAAIGMTIGAAGPDKVETIPPNAATIESPADLKISEDTFGKRRDGQCLQCLIGIISFRLDIHAIRH